MEMYDLENLENLEKESIKRGIPIIGRDKGKWLHEKVRETKPKKILELGTAIGYSGCILGSFGAELTTIEIDSKAAEEAKSNFKKFNINAKVIVGDGIREVQNLVKDKKNLGSFDTIFIDFAKKKYIQALENCIKLVKKSGLIIADNTSWVGGGFREAVLSDPRLRTEVIAIEDEMTCSDKVA